MHPNYRQLARFSSPETLPAAHGKAPERNLTKLFGAFTDVNTEKQERISNRLTYVQQLLKMRKTTELTPQQQSNRTQLLNLLELYVMLGKYPSDYDQKVKERLCFKDASGRRCAIGFMIERTAGQHLADIVCDQESLEFLVPAHKSAYEAWLAQSGMTSEELAMIQPNFSGQAPADSQAPSGVSQTFASLREASQRRGSYPDSAFVGASPEAVVLAGHRPSPQKQNTILVNTAASPTGATADSQLRVFFLSSAKGEPVVAMTFSSSC